MAKNQHFYRRKKIPVSIPSTRYPFTKRTVSISFRHTRSWLLIDGRMRSRSRLSLVHETGRLHFL